MTNDLIIPTTSEPASAKDAKPRRELKISKRLRHALELLADGTCRLQKDAAAQAGLNAEYLSKALAKDHVQAFIARETARNIGTAQMRASKRVIQLMDASSEHVSMQASEFVLGVGGIKVKADAQPLVNINITPGMIINLGSRKHPPVIDQHRPNDLKPLIQNDPEDV